MKTETKKLTVEYVLDNYNSAITWDGDYACVFIDVADSDEATKIGFEGDFNLSDPIDHLGGSQDQYYILKDENNAGDEWIRIIIVDDEGDEMSSEDIAIKLAMLR